MKLAIMQSGRRRWTIVAALAGSDASELDSGSGMHEQYARPEGYFVVDAEELEGDVFGWIICFWGKRLERERRGEAQSLRDKCVF